MSGLGWGLVAPALLLGALGWAVPAGLARVWPEGVGPLAALAALSTLALLALSALVFAALYVWAGAPPGRLVAQGGPGTWHFLRLGAMAGLVWGPILALTVAGLPRRWRVATW